jgi:serine/threonine protein kinase
MEPGKKFHTFCGSLHYGTSLYFTSHMAACPEILTGQAYLGPGVDIWSMGIILYCLVVGRQPWDGNNADELMRAILQDGLEIPEGISDGEYIFLRLFFSSQLHPLSYFPMQSAYTSYCRCCE